MDGDWRCLRLTDSFLGMNLGDFNSNFVVFWHNFQGSTTSAIDFFRDIVAVAKEVHVTSLTIADGTIGD
ncbi:hypothetical protein PanWU01x14_264110 [Parasponia andersonii]|uniref:Uncharacterized protein n=1 Tax=Parasponia andersonii TaxID=3476 RepID=A0A2P5B7S7_PARAD|nr:hypothetical protein PanWU01x14_264110 [Parasponia andersonii]